MEEKEMLNVKDFYPTPKSLLEKVFTGLEWSMIETVLEPSAGKGDIVDFIIDKYDSETRYHSSPLDIDCIEIDHNLRSILKGKDMRVVHDNFLTFNTFKKYNLIVMNPPFCNGEKHLLKALDMQKNGGNIICILNAETLKNPYSNERKTLVAALKEYEATIDFMHDEFESAERKTSVEIAVIKIAIPEVKKESKIYEEIKKKRYAESYVSNKDYLEDNYFVKAIVSQYNIELESGIKLIQEYDGLKPYILNNLRENAYSSAILKLKIDNSDCKINQFVELVNAKYWTALFQNPKFTKHMTSNQINEYSRKVNELRKYDFSFYNINSIRVEMSKGLINGIEECIVKLFDDLTYKHSWYPESEKNIHYFDGWATNKAWIINKKVIIPLKGYYDMQYSWGRYNPSDYKVIEKLSDIEKALNYLDGGLTESIDLRNILKKAEDEEQTKKIQLKYFTVTFYKKGTCHIEFTNMELLKKLNIFGSQQKGWLPPSYGNKAYSEMSKEEKSVINSFEGEISYKDTLAKADYYIFKADKIPMLENIA